MLDDPNFAQMMNESMNNPDVIQMLETQPMIANNPMLRNMIRNPEMRRMLFNPEMLRAQLQMQRSMGGGDGSFPMPGATDTTPGAGAAGTQPGATGGNTQQAQNPFGNMGMLGGFPPPAGGAQGNPFAALFGNPPAAGAGTTPTTSPPPTGSAGGQGTPATNTDQAQQNPFANLFGGAGAGAGAGGGGSDIFGMAQQMMQNPEMMRSMFGTPPAGGDGQAPGAAAGAGAGNQANPFGAMFNPWGGAQNQAQNPPDDRPPEERYAEQLRQLNDMGFFEFDRNIQALRRSGGSVQGAIEFLLGGS
jgi:ubiquilin